MQGETVRLTVQIQGHDNLRRVTEKIDVPLSDVAATATELAARMTRYYRKEKAQAAHA